MKTSVVLGLTFGDEGKGRTTSFLSNADDLVVRFNGGHQAGHTVIHNGIRHVFSNFGAGTLKGAHTYWSEYCTFNPVSFYNEKKALNVLGIEPVFYCHPRAMITTPFDIYHNRDTELVNQHGSVGVGFGATIARNENTPYKLYALDLQYPQALVYKLKNIAAHYGYSDKEAEGEIYKFLAHVEAVRPAICTLSAILHQYKNIIFEGAQGIMLDMDHGFFPNVTRSNTTSKNAIQIIKEHHLPSPEMYYVMRPYLTRHGNGFMPGECKDFRFEDETNQPHEYQGILRQGYHSSDMLSYALNCDYQYSGYDKNKKHLIINLLGQTDGQILINYGSVGTDTFIKAMSPFFNNVSETWEHVQKTSA